MLRKGRSSDNAACEAFFERLKVKLFYCRDWFGWSAEAFIGALSDYIRWYGDGRLKAFDEGGSTMCDTIGAAGSGSG